MEDQQKSWTNAEIHHVRSVTFGGATGKVICSSYCVCVEWDTHTGQYTYDVFRKLLQEGAFTIGGKMLNGSGVARILYDRIFS